MIVSTKLLIILVALSVVCAISIFGSIAHWISDQFDGRSNGDPDRWKWMCTVSMVLMLIGMFIV